MSNDVWQRIEEARTRWNVLEHPFYQRWSAGELTSEELARYSGQYRYAVEAIATMSENAAVDAPERADLREALGRSGRDYVAREYDWGVVESRTDAFLARILASRAQPGVPAA